MANKNKYSIVKINRRNFIQKKYKSPKRFFSELKYIKIFRERNIPVSNIYSFDRDKRLIILEKINGKNSEILQQREIKLCVDMLSHISLIFGIERKNNTEVRKYISKVKYNIIWWCNKNNFKIDKKKLEILLEDLKKVCFISIFKDSRPSNWIFQKDKIYAIDFDYVKKSFFLADLAQFLSYVSLRKNIKTRAYLNYYLKKTLPNINNFEKFHTPFMVAIINSNIASKIHRDNLFNITKTGFDKQNRDILKKLKIIK